MIGFAISDFSNEIASLFADGFIRFDTDGEYIFRADTK